MIENKVLCANKPEHNNIYMSCNFTLHYKVQRGANALLGPEDIENPKRALENGA